MEQARLPALSPDAANRLSYQERRWREVKQKLALGKTIDLTQGGLRLVVIVESRQPCALRFAAGQDTEDGTFSHFGEFHFLAQPGCNIMNFASNEFRTARGSPDYSAANHLAFGGENEEAEVLFYLTDTNGNPVLERLPGSKPLESTHLVLSSVAKNQLCYRNRMWQDLERKLLPKYALDLTRRSLHLVAILQGRACVLRFAAGQDASGRDYAHVGELHFSLKPGFNVFTFAAAQLSTLRGSPDYSVVNHLGFGGEAENAEITFYLSDEFGSPLLLSESFRS